MKQALINYIQSGNELAALLFWIGHISFVARGFTALLKAITLLVKKEMKIKNC